MAVGSLRMDLSSSILLRLMMMARAAVGDVIRDLRIDWDMMLVGWSQPCLDQQGKTEL